MLVASLVGTVDLQGESHLFLAEFILLPLLFLLDHLFPPSLECSSVDPIASGRRGQAYALHAVLLICMYLDILLMENSTPSCRNDWMMI